MKKNYRYQIEGILIQTDPLVSNTATKKQIVRATYANWDEFIVPEGIDLENTEQVERWCIKYNELHIKLKNGDEIEVESEGWIDDFDYKYPFGDPTIEYEEEEEEEPHPKKKLPPPKLKSKPINN